MRKVVFTVIALALASSAGAQVAEPKNPFSPHAASSAPSAPAQASTQPSQLLPPGAMAPAPSPGSYLPPRIPLPPPQLKLPPVVVMKSLPPAEAAGGERPPGAAEAPDAPASAAPKKDAVPDVFRTRESIEKSRAACQVTLKTSTIPKVASDGASVRIQFANNAPKPCFMAMQSDKSWAIPRTANASAVDVEVQPNPTRRARTTRVVIATANDRWTLSITQNPGSEDIEELNLDAQEKADE